MRLARIAIVVGTTVALWAPPPAAAQSWGVRATVAESCSCNVSCPCNFGSAPTRMPCEGNRVIAFEAGSRHGDIELDGVTLLVTFSMSRWSKIYVSDDVSATQMTAVESLLPLAFAGFHRGMLSFTRAPITMEITEDSVRFSGPESSVDMDVMRGHGGEIVKVLNLPSPTFQDYTQYVSTSHTHDSVDHAFSYSGTSGFTSRMDVSGTTP